MKWRPVSEIPLVEYEEGFPNVDKVLVYGPVFWVTFGRVARFRNGDIISKADGFYGNWQITHWMPLPEPPQ